MRDAKDEKEKMSLWDQHMAQKRLDERPKKDTIKIKLSELFKSICNKYEDNLNEQQKQEMQKKAEMEME